MDVILYSTGCPKCNVLKKKLDAKGIQYTVNNSVEEMEAIGIVSVPVLRANGEMLPFSSAVEWVNSK